jgi:hypothetical protein
MALVVAVLLAASCGDPAISRRTSRDLQSQVATIRTAVEGGQVVLARQQLGNLLEEVDRLLERDAIGEAKAIEIVESAEAVRAALRLVASSTPTETVTPSPSVEEGGEGEEGGGYGDKGKGNDKDRDKGKGHGNDD